MISEPRQNEIAVIIAGYFEDYMSKCHTIPAYNYISEIHKKEDFTKEEAFYAGYLFGNLKYKYTGDGG